MFGLIRLPFLLAVAFVAGMMYERSEKGKLCDEIGGTTRNGLCIMRTE
ncbi:MULTISPECIES: hypothetical protein [Donghicola]|jgi:hypothetical protein|uniref:Uncharacterized protein n=1 Tax=Donghicola eburneus TaxID=393278 RepID=A0A1M4N4K5_9RHOB|nr:MULTISPECIES: hypothetical protein [Donghicola]MCI5042459.1 hypothetical protein [Donghicola eburneus]MCT4578018.1 hypothetical protein [Donghicola sp.]SCM69719.1 hypothetical protein KARMA_3960 [Donghicola eburneus]SFQ63934.1 hypothetical protein SAMN05421764_10867 [Donghicola eburneus]